MVKLEIGIDFKSTKELTNISKKILKNCMIIIHLKTNHVKGYSFSAKKQKIKKVTFFTTKK